MVKNCSLSKQEYHF